MNDEAPRWADRIVELRRERKDKVLELRQEGMPMAEIADALGVAVGTVHADLTGEDVTPTPAPAPTATTAGRTTPVERLQSGSLPTGAAAEDDIDAGKLADRILRRPW